MRFEIESRLIKSGRRYICGVDESGLGSLAGDVYVGAVMFPADVDRSLLLKIDDSKKKTPEQREQLAQIIRKHALSYSIGTASVGEIDEHNVYWARFMAANRAIDALDVKPDYLLMDGNAKIPDTNIPQEAVVKGDTKSVSIAAASILAKTERDKYIIELAGSVHTDYSWSSNKAYYTPDHVEALKKHGATQWHRKKFISKIVGK